MATYNDIVTAWGSLIPMPTTTVGGVVSFSDASGRYINEIPRTIEYAEGLMYRDPDLDFLATRQTDSTQTTAAGSRYVTIPATFIVLERLNLITPAGAAPDAAGANRVPLTRTTSAVLDMMWPQASLVLPPAFGLTHWAIFDQQETSPASKVRIVPTPDAIYTAEFLGTFRPAPLAQTAGASTFLTTYLPDLFLAATMIHWSAVMKSWGAMSDDGQQGTSWQKLYATSKTGAALEEARKKSISSGWSSFAPAQFAAQPR